MIPSRVERLIMRRKEVDVVHPKQPPSESIDAFDLFTSGFLCIQSLRTLLTGASP